MNLIDRGNALSIVLKPDQHAQMDASAQLTVGSVCVRDLMEFVSVARVAQVAKQAEAHSGVIRILERAVRQTQSTDTVRSVRYHGTRGGRTFWLGDRLNHRMPLGLV